MAKIGARQVQTLQDGLHSDGDNLYLRVSGNRRSWVFRYKQGGAVRVLGLGGTNARTLAEARSLAFELRNALANGIDPRKRLADLTGRKEEVPTFAVAAAMLIESKRAGWRNAKHAQQWANTLRDYAFPRLGRMKPGAVALSDVVAVLSPIWQTKTETATRLRQRIEAVLDYCRVHGWRDGDNPARWRGTLDKVLPPPQRLKSRGHFAAAEYRELPEIMRGLEKQRGTSALCLRFVILTACRSGEARGALWEEFDLDAGVWTVPAERMKASRPHRVALSPEALAVLRDAGAMRLAGSGFVFPSMATGRRLSDVSVSKALHAVRDGITVHGMRAAFKTWAEEMGRHPSKVIEAALARSSGDKVEAAYMRSALFEQRRRLMEDWARWCMPRDAKVIPLGASVTA